MQKLYYDFGYASKADPLWDLSFELEPQQFPFKKETVAKCPASIASYQHTWIARATIDADVYFDKENCAAQCTNVTREAFNEVFHIDDIRNLNNVDLITMQVVSPRFIFWTPKQDHKKNIQIWIHDVPQQYLTEYRNWFIVQGFLPKNFLHREVVGAITMKPGETHFSIKRGDPLCAISILCDEKVKLKRKQIPQEIWDDQHRKSFMKMFCPYTYSKKIYERFL